MRLFVAINFNTEIINRLFNVVQRLQSHALKGNFTRKENLHLTLAFIGETPRVAEAKQALDCIDESCFTLKLGGLGFFPRQGGSIYWLGVEKDAKLDSLHNQLSSNLAASGFAIEKRSFRPHLTLGREIVLKDDFDMKEFTRNIPALEMRVQKISLMKSERLNGKLIYTEIYAKELS